MKVPRQVWELVRKLHESLIERDITVVEDGSDMWRDKPMQVQMLRVSQKIYFVLTYEAFWENVLAINMGDYEGLLRHIEKSFESDGSLIRFIHRNKLAYKRAHFAQWFLVYKLQSITVFFKELNAVLGEAQVVLGDFMELITKLGVAASKCFQVC